LLAALLLLITGCRAIPTPTRIALLAPFEGRYREIGYGALYAARLALQDTGTNFIELLPVEDGGTPASATMRARALRTDPHVAAVLVLGLSATDSAVLAELKSLPVLVVGEWGIPTPADGVYILSNSDISRRLSVRARTDILDAAQLPAPLTGGDMLALTQLGDLRPSLNGITILSSAALPDEQFTERYEASDSFAPEPGLLASLSYDAAHMTANAALNGQGNRSAVEQYLRDVTYTGLNGPIRFENSYWADAPIHEYTYSESGKLLPVDHVVE
jgi:ABC-type branched-subunit amino acid transport system substrate-binding protein